MPSGGVEGPSRLAVGPFPKGSKVLDMTKTGSVANAKPRKGGSANAFTPVAPSVPSPRPLKILKPEKR